MLIVEAGTRFVVGEIRGIGWVATCATPAESHPKTCNSFEHLYCWHAYLPRMIAQDESDI